MEKEAMAWSAHSNRLTTGIASVDLEFHVRDCRLDDLDGVSDLMVRAFCRSEPNEMSQHLYRMQELDRLKMKYPYADKDKHRMLVAVCNEKIIGFCDIDCRAVSAFAFYKNNPRPLVSDLVVHPSGRRRGVASTLINICEAVAFNDFHRDKIYLRVVESNIPAINMYVRRLGYQFIPNDGDPVETLLLRKKLHNGMQDSAITSRISD